MPSLCKHCHRSQDETGRESRGGPETQARRSENERGEVEAERSTAVVCGEEGRQADRGEGVRKDKVRGENVAGFKGCRLAWPRRSHEVYGCVVCWVLWNRLAVSGHAVCSWLIWSSHRRFSRNAGKSRLGREWLGPFRAKACLDPSVTQASAENRHTEPVSSETVPGQ